MSDAFHDREEAKQALASYRIGGTRFRFPQRDRWLFGVGCVGTIVACAIVLLGSCQFGAFEWVVSVGIGVTTLVIASLSIPGLCWVEIEEHPAVWMLRRRHGWLLRQHKIDIDKISIAGVTESFRREWLRRTHHIQIVLAGSRREPIRLNVTAWPVPLMLLVCRLLAPGHSDTTYLLNTNIRKRRR